MVHGKIQAFINKAKTYAKGGGTTPHELQTLHTEAVSLSKQISLGAIKEDDKIIEKLQQLVQTRNHALQRFDSLATEYYSLLETLLKYGTGYRTKMVKELSETMQGCYLKYDEYLEISKHELTRPLIAYKKTYEKPLEHGIKLSSYYTRNKGKTDLIPPHILAKIKPDGMGTN